MPRPTPTLVIFDCDGVLVDTETTSSRALAETATAAGVPMTAAGAMTAYRGRSLRYVIADLGHRLGRPLPASWPDDFETARNRAFRTGVTAIPGADAAVRGVVAAGLAICVASQGSTEKMRLTLGLTGLDAHFPADARFSADAVAHPKPAPDLFLHAATAMGHPPARCAVVEDSITGVTAARAAGMHVLGYAADADAAALQAAGGEAFQNMREVPARVLSWAAVGPAARP